MLHVLGVDDGHQSVVRGAHEAVAEGLGRVAGPAGRASLATAHMKAASSRAIAVQVTVVFLPRAVSAR